MGRQAHQPTAQSRRYVESASGLGATQDGLAKILGISVSTLGKHYAKEFATGTEKANITVAGKLYSLAASDSQTQAAVIARIFWLKSRARWRETSVVEHSGPDGAPLGDKRPVVVILPDNGRTAPPVGRTPRLIEGEAALDVTPTEPAKLTRSG